MHDWQMTPREHLGMSIAAMTKLTRKGLVWLVPSQSSPKRYTVSPDPKSPHCTCPDHDETGQRCKHIFAVEYVLRREDNADGSTTVTERLTVTHRIQKTYPQNWPSYNAAQTNEKTDFQRLLFDLCQEHVVDPPQTRGRPRIPLADQVFIATLKVYSTMSARRFMCDLQDTHARGYIAKVPHFNSVLNALDDEAMRSTLVDLIIKSSLPFTAFETIFAADSTGFTTSRYVNWFEKKHRGGGRREHDWVKAHFTCGVRSNVVTAVEIGPRDAQDSPYLPPMIRTTAKHFQIAEVLGDKAYGSVDNHNAIVAHGGVGYIPFKTIHNGNSGGLWRRKFHEFHANRDEFLRHYHQRSNAETTVQMIKSKFRDEVRAKTEPAMINEVLCKFLAHNICCLIQATYEVGLDVDFGMAKAA